MASHKHKSDEAAASNAKVARLDAEILAETQRLFVAQSQFKHLSLKRISTRYSSQWAVFIEIAQSILPADIINLLDRFASLPPYYENMMSEANIQLMTSGASLHMKFEPTFAEVADMAMRRRQSRMIYLAGSLPRYTAHSIMNALLDWIKLMFFGARVVEDKKKCMISIYYGAEHANELKSLLLEAGVLCCDIEVD